MLMADLIKDFEQTKTANVECYPVSRQDSDIHAEQNDNLERHEVFEDLLQCRRCVRSSRRGETFCGCGRVLGITDAARKQAEQRIISRLNVCVHGINDQH